MTVQHTLIADVCLVQVLDAEPVKKLKISQQLRSMIQACATIHGQEFQIAMGRVDPAITGQMHAIIG